MSDQVTAGEASLDGVTVVELVASIARESFGLGCAALNLAAALERRGANVFLASVDEEKDALEVCEEARFPRERLIRGSLVGAVRLRIAPLLLRQLLRISHSERHVVHMHGRWTYVSWVAGELRKQWKCPLVLSPHGQLDSYALKLSPKKKALASWLYERRNLRESRCVWALSEQERASVQEYGYRGRVAVIPNGVSRAIHCSVRELEDFRSRHQLAETDRVLLFLSRVAPAKNLPMLLRAFARNVKAESAWKLVIAGSGEGGHIHEVRSLIHELGIGDSVRLIGQVNGKEKASAFCCGSLFVLPSLTEGLPIAALEAMEYGKPILVTDVWTLPVQTGPEFGWRVPAEERAFGSALLEAMSTPEETLMELGGNARRMVRAHFDWDSIAEQASSLYASLLTGIDQVQNHSDRPGS